MANSKFSKLGLHLWWKRLPEHIDIGIDSQVSASNEKKAGEQADRLISLREGIPLVDEVSHLIYAQTADVTGLLLRNDAFESAHSRAGQKPNWSRGGSRFHSSSRSCSDNPEPRYYYNRFEAKAWNCRQHYTWINSKYNTENSTYFSHRRWRRRVLFSKFPDSSMPLDGIQLRTSNSSDNPTYGTFHGSFDFVFRHAMSWTFWVGDILHPILGANALTILDLIPDFKRQRLVYNLKKFHVKSWFKSRGRCQIDPNCKCDNKLTAISLANFHAYLASINYLSSKIVACFTTLRWLLHLITTCKTFLTQKAEGRQGIISTPLCGWSLPPFRHPLSYPDPILSEKEWWLENPWQCLLPQYGHHPW